MASRNPHDSPRVRAGISISLCRCGKGLLGRAAARAQTPMPSPLYHASCTRTKLPWGSVAPILPPTYQALPRASPRSRSPDPCPLILHGPTSPSFCDFPSPFLSCISRFFPVCPPPRSPNQRKSPAVVTAGPWEQGLPQPPGRL